MSILPEIEKKIEQINPDQDLLYKKWNIQHRDELFTNIYWSYSPMTEKYFFEANPAFYYEFKNIFDFARYPITLMRDGFIGILEFFLLYPKPPKDFTSQLLIAKKFQKVIPKSWAAQVATYEVVETTQEERNPFLFIFGTPTEQLFVDNPLESLAKEVSELVSQYDDYLIYLPVRETMLSDAKKKKNLYYMQFMKEIYRNVGFDVKVDFHNIGNIQKLLEAKKFDFFNLDKTNYFIADNYMDHQLYSIGGKSVAPGSTDSKGLEYQLSENHKMIISDVDFSENCFAEFFYQFKVGGQKTRSIYEVFQSEQIRELFLKHFSKMKS